MAEGIITRRGGGGAQFIEATGGTVTDITDGGVDYRVHTFTSSGTFEVTSGGEVEYLVVAGGGGGRGGGDNVATDRGGAAGGAGGYRSSVVGENSGGGYPAEPKLNLLPGTYTIEVGAGGAGGTNGTRNNQTGGNDSYIADSSGVRIIQSMFGGCGGASAVVTIDPEYNLAAFGGQDGGSGGGAMGTAGGEAPKRARGQAGQGFAGGAASAATSGGGGGGAGGVGESGVVNSAVRTAGGAGVSSAITGSSVTYAAGGRGGAAKDTTDDAAAGLANTGQGGDGGNLVRVGAAGGSGVVIVRYRIG